MGINRRVLTKISVVTTLGLQLYKEARLMLATAKGTIISIKIMPWTKRERSVKLRIKVEAKGIRINFCDMTVIKMDFLIERSSIP